MSCRNASVTLAALALGLSSASPVITAAERELEFQLVTKLTEPRVIDAPNVDGHAINQAKAFGVGVFKDGRIAVKDFVVVLDLNKGNGPMFGYSTYNFDDGSSITARFNGDFKINQPVHGEYKILSGTGSYAGATGTGTMDSLPSKFKNVGLYNVKLKVVTP